MSARRGLAAVALLGALTLGCAPAAPALDVRPALAELAPVAAGLRIAPDGSARGYDRDRFGVGWAPAGRRGCDTRDVILARDVQEVTAADRCGPTAGALADPYTGRRVAGPTRALDVDHVVPLALAWRSGAAGWDERRRERFANDPANLRTTSASTNRSKGDEGPETWLPPVDRCGYARSFASVARAWDLTVTPARAAALDGACS